MRTRSGETEENVQAKQMSIISTSLSLIVTMCLSSMPTCFSEKKIYSSQLCHDSAEQKQLKYFDEYAEVTL